MAIEKTEPRYFNPNEGFDTGMNEITPDNRPPIDPLVGENLRHACSHILENTRNTNGHEFANEILSALVVPFERVIQNLENQIEQEQDKIKAEIDSAGGGTPVYDSTDENILKIENLTKMIDELKDVTSIISSGLNEQNFDILDSREAVKKDLDTFKDDVKALLKEGDGKYDNNIVIVATDHKNKSSTDLDRIVPTLDKLLVDNPKMIVRSFDYSKSEADTSVKKWCDSNNVAFEKIPSVQTANPKDWGMKRNDNELSRHGDNIVSIVTFGSGGLVKNMAQKGARIGIPHISLSDSYPNEKPSIRQAVLGNSDRIKNPSNASSLSPEVVSVGVMSYISTLITLGKNSIGEEKFEDAINDVTKKITNTNFEKLVEAKLKYINETIQETIQSYDQNNPEVMQGLKSTQKVLQSQSDFIQSVKEQVLDVYHQYMGKPFSNPRYVNNEVKNREMENAGAEFIRKLNIDDFKKLSAIPDYKNVIVYLGDKDASKAQLNVIPYLFNEYKQRYGDDLLVVVPGDNNDPSEREVLQQSRQGIDMLVWPINDWSKGFKTGASLRNDNIVKYFAEQGKLRGVLLGSNNMLPNFEDNADRTFSVASDLLSKTSPHNIKYFTLDKYLEVGSNRLTLSESDSQPSGISKNSTNKIDVDMLADSTVKLMQVIAKDTRSAQIDRVGNTALWNVVNNIYKECKSLNAQANNLDEQIQNTVDPTIKAGLEHKLSEIETVQENFESVLDKIEPKYCELTGQETWVPMPEPSNVYKAENLSDEQKSSFKNIFVLASAGERTTPKYNYEKQILWGYMDKVHSKYPDMKLVTFGAKANPTENSKFHCKFEKSAIAWAKDRRVDVVKHGPNFSEHGKEAVWLRNNEILDQYNVRGIIGVGDNVGIAKDMIDKATSLNITHQFVSNYIEKSQQPPMGKSTEDILEPEPAHTAMNNFTPSALQTPDSDTPTTLILTDDGIRTKSLAEYIKSYSDTIHNASEYFKNVSFAYNGHTKATHNLYTMNGKTSPTLASDKSVLDTIGVVSLSAGTYITKIEDGKQIQELSGSSNVNLDEILRDSNKREVFASCLANQEKDNSYIGLPLEGGGKHFVKASEIQEFKPSPDVKYIGSEVTIDQLHEDRGNLMLQNVELKDTTTEELKNIYDATEMGSKCLIETPAQFIQNGLNTDMPLPDKNTLASLVHQDTNYVLTVPKEHTPNGEPESMGITNKSEAVQKVCEIVNPIYNKTTIEMSSDNESGSRYFEIAETKINKDMDIISSVTLSRENIKGAEISL